MTNDQPAQRNTPATDRLSPSAVAQALLTVVLWGGTPVAISFAVEVFPPFVAAGVRFLLASVVMLVWTQWERVNLRLTRTDVGPSLVAGFLLFAQIGLFTIGVKWSNASHGSLFINTYIFWVAAIEHYVTRTDRITTRKLFGLILAAIGVLLALVTTPSAKLASANSGNLTGDVVVLVSAFVLGIKIVYTKYAVQFVDPGKLMFWHDVFGVIMFGTASVLSEKHSYQLSSMTPTVRSACLGLLYDGLLVAGLCFGINARLLRKYSASKVSVFSSATPLFGIVFGVLFRSEPLSSWIILAGLFVAAGIFIVNQKEDSR